MTKIVSRLFLSFLCLGLLFAWNPGGALALHFIEDGCLDCHFDGSTIVPGTKQFELGTSWHTSHMGYDSSCVLCHPSSPGNTPIPTDNCTTCHTNATCEWQDFHTSNQTYNENITGFTCSQCHIQCAQPGDADGDGVPDSEDNCPGTSNQDQNDFMPPGGNTCGDACECEGNFNPDVDDDVDGSDAALFKADFGRGGYNNLCESGNPCNGDFECDSDVDGSDAAIFKADFGRGGYNNPCPTCPVPDPWCN